MNLPIYQATSHDFEDAEDAAQQFALEKSGAIYSRLMNPTVAALQERIAARRRRRRSANRVRSTLQR